ncbi:MAG: glycine-rich domain-containing protein [Kiritimatiellia bacterium]
MAPRRVRLWRAEHSSTVVSDDGVLNITAGGGGAGGNYNTSYTALAAGAAADGSGGGGTYGQAGGGKGDSAYSNDGGSGNTSVNTGKTDLENKSAAGGGGGALEPGFDGTADMPPGGGMGGKGFECTLTGVSVSYGAGGGGVRYMTGNGGANWSSHGRGGSNMGGNGADPVNKVPATAGVANTGAGGGGVDSSTGDGDSSLWKGGDGADGVVLVAYVMRGQKDLEGTPVVDLNRVAYDPTTWIQTFDYRVSWAGELGGACSLYLLYGTNEADVRAVTDGLPHPDQGVDRAELFDAANALGIGSVEREALVTATNWWVRLVAQAPDGRIAVSPQVLPLEIPGLNLDSAAWVPGEGAILENGSVVLTNRFHWTRRELDSVILDVLWSENEDDLKGDASGQEMKFWSS